MPYSSRPTEGHAQRTQARKGVRNLFHAASTKVMGGLLVTKDERLLKLQAIASIW